MEFLLSLLLLFPVFMMAVVIHEVSHGWAALRLGDDTALRAGRLTLNPLKHIDPIGTVVLPLALVFFRSPFVFGWAKPVPVSFLDLAHPKRDMIWVGAAGPLSNFLMAGATASLLRWAAPFLPEWIQALAQYFVLVNLVLGTFNLLPIPPLDGSRILAGILPASWARRLLALEPWGIVLVLAALYLGVMERFLWPLVRLLLKGLGV
ncbi:MAG: site-2 protease family protein [Candidatus Omnitrophica bacterium]|nr:site-2 protease family protein [Candidatus Omnitrophota bacterium]